MPVIINELTIRAQVADKPSGGSNNNSSMASGGRAAADEKEALVQECVAQVLEILEKKKMP